MKKILKNPILILSFLIIAITLIITFTNFNNWDHLKGLLYPTLIESEIEGSKKNVLEILAFESEHAADKEDYEFDEKEIWINQVDPDDNDNKEDFNLPPEVNAKGETPYTVESNQDMKNILLEAPSRNFVGWSGCDAADDNLCQISVTNNQRRKIEAHYSIPEGGSSLQLFSMSNNAIEGALTEDWINDINPSLVFKAAHNSLKGYLPDNLGNLRARMQLNLGGNDFKGEIPKSIGDLNVKYLGLYKNNLSGKIPKEIGNLNPKYFLLYNNELSGLIPEEIGNLGSQVQRFELHNNKLTGQVPIELLDIGTLKPNELRLYNNRLTSVERDFMEKAPWDGINFHNNNFGIHAIKTALYDAAKNEGGNYIDFCGNAPLIKATYSANGKYCHLTGTSEVNQAVEKWEKIYVEAKLEQKSSYYTGSCEGYCNGSVKERWDDCDWNCIHGEGKSKEECCEEKIEYCALGSLCIPGTAWNTYWPLNFRYLKGNYCILITEPIHECEDTEYIPNTVNHAAEYPDCNYWKHLECKPICESGTCDGTVENCPDTSDWYCEVEDFEEGRDTSTTKPGTAKRECQ